MRGKHRTTLARPDRLRHLEDEIAHLRDLDLRGLRARWQSVFQRTAAPSPATASAVCGPGLSDPGRSSWRPRSRDQKGFWIAPALTGGGSAMADAAEEPGPKRNGPDPGHGAGAGMGPADRIG